MAFTYLKVKSAKCHLLTFGGLGLGLKSLVLFTTLERSSISDTQLGSGMGCLHVKIWRNKAVMVKVVK